MQIRRRYQFRGVVQGVGFRPAVYRCAAGLGLAGFVQNRRSEVVAEVQGDAAALERFMVALRRLLPPAARIDEVKASDVPSVAGESGFRIAESASSAFTFPPIPSDLALCADCRRELLDPRDRRHLYPFISCTQCGPRYTIVEDTPFDRETTSMTDFPLCPECRREYEDPDDRRFHAQTTSCPRCGPRLTLRDGAGAPVPGDPVLGAIEALAAGLVVAVQGIGGFHLAADPRAAAAISRLRRDKDRERRPFAVMVRDLRVAEELCLLDAASRAELASARSPIVVLEARDGRLSAVSQTGTLGLMLPYTPLHLLLFLHPAAPVPYSALVMTSANAHGEPMVTRAEEALARLKGAADLVLSHDRRILYRTDDSVLLPVVQSAGGGAFRGTCLVRRSRGYVPELLSLGRDLGRRVLAAGGDLKNAPALGMGREIHLAPFIGDLDDPLTRDDFEAHIHRLLGLYRIEPDEVLYDPHPLYRSTAWALRFPAARRTAVQHHHAHILSVMAEHGLEECLGLAFDGTGYGGDGTIWGGELLHATRSRFRRLGSFSPFRLPGGERAVMRPLRIAFALLAGGAGAPGGRPEIGELPAAEQAMLTRMLESGAHAPLCSSLGRIFDAAAALLGLVTEVSYEGEGPILLEAAARSAARAAAGAAVRRPPGRPAGEAPAASLVRFVAGDPFELDARPLIGELARRRGEEPVAGLALLFHREIAAAAAAGALAMRRATGIATLALSGGVFHNALLRELLIPPLLEAGFAVYTNVRVPPGDGGLAVGQAYFVPGGDDGARR